MNFDWFLPKSVYTSHSMSHWELLVRKDFISKNEEGAGDHTSKSNERAGKGGLVGGKKKE